MTTITDTSLRDLARRQSERILELTNEAVQMRGEREQLRSAIAGPHGDGAPSAMPAVFRSNRSSGQMIITHWAGPFWNVMSPEGFWIARAKDRDTAQRIADCLSATETVALESEHD